MRETVGTVLIFGCGGHSRSVADVLLTNQPGLNLLFVDENAIEGEEIYNFKTCRNYAVNKELCFIAIGDNEKRKKKSIEVKDSSLISVISKTAQVSRRATIGRGCFIGNSCHVGPVASIGENSIVNTAAIIEHEVHIGKFCHIGPNSTISGRCKIGDLVFIGAGSVVKDYISICSDVSIGAGAVVVRDIGESGVYAGCPAKKIR